MSLTRVCRGKVRRKIVSFCVLSSLLLFIYVSLKLLTTHEIDSVASSRRRFPKRSVRGGDENENVIPPPLQLRVPPDTSNKTDLNKVILPYKYGGIPTFMLKEGMTGNYEPSPEVNRVGPGEHGLPVLLQTPQDQEKRRTTLQEFGFNLAVSDKIAMDRAIPDTRPDECKRWKYPLNLPKTSVVIVFHNEGWSPLLRTVHSVVNRTPKKLLKEVVMFDDYSDKSHLGKPLEEYLETTFGDVVKLYRAEKREGLINARSMGAKYSTGDVVVFLDAHCEVGLNWLPPLVSRIAFNRTIMTVPIVDSIDWDTFAYRSTYASGKLFRGIFEWGFLYKENEVPEKERQRHAHFSEPYASPTHAGGLFAIDREFFLKLGGYDPGLLIWGGENYELSFKIWMCGGSIEWVPCSHVGHVYRNHMPYTFGNINTKISPVLLNYRRVAEVWLDEYAEYLYRREPPLRYHEAGDLSAQKKFRDSHRCQSFKWFMDNVAYDVEVKYPLPSENFFWGEIVQEGVNTCWDTYGLSWGETIGASSCHHGGGNQMFRLNVDGQMASGERCLDAGGMDGSASIFKVDLIWCPNSNNGPWKYDVATKQIRHEGKKLCADTNGKKSGYLRLKTCDASRPSQRWITKKVRTG